MNELDSFTINFITNGLDKLLDGMKDLRTSMDALDQSFATSSTKGDSFFGKFTAWGTKITGLVAGIVSIGKAVKDAFNIANETVNLHQEADRLGRKASDIETLWHALREHNTALSDSEAMGLSVGFFDAINNIRTKNWRLSLSPEIIKELEYAQVGAFNPNDSDQEIMRKIIQVAQYHQANGNPGATAALFSAIGLNQKLIPFFNGGEQYVDALLKIGSTKNFRSSEADLKQSDALLASKNELSDEWKKLVKQLTPTLTKITNLFVDLLKSLQPFVKYIDIAFDWVVASVSWIKEKLSWLWDWFKDKNQSNQNYFDEKFAFSRIASAVVAGYDADLGEYDTLKEFLDDLQKAQSGFGKTIKATEANKEILDAAQMVAREVFNHPELYGSNSLTNKTVKFEQYNNQTYNVPSTREIKELDDRNNRNAAQVAILGM